VLNCRGGFHHTALIRIHLPYEVTTSSVECYLRLNQFTYIDKDDKEADKSFTF
jgi:hypothetical protein